MFRNSFRWMGLAAFGLLTTFAMPGEGDAGRAVFPGIKLLGPKSIKVGLKKNQVVGLRGINLRASGLDVEVRARITCPRRRDYVSYYHIVKGNRIVGSGSMLTLLKKKVRLATMAELQRACGTKTYANLTIPYQIKAGCKERSYSNTTRRFSSYKGDFKLKVSIQCGQMRVKARRMAVVYLFTCKPGFKIEGTNRRSIEIRSRPPSWPPVKYCVKK